MKPLIIVQARMGSSRLPGKVAAPLGRATQLEQVLARCSLSRRARGVAVATTTEARDEVVVAIATRAGVPVFRGSEVDVLGRYVDAAATFAADAIVRITADCPLIDPAIIDECIALADAECDYASVDGYPNGLGDAEWVSRAALERAHRETTAADTYAREHVTPYVITHPEKFRVHNAQAPSALVRPKLHLSVDESADLGVVRAVTDHFAPRLDFTTAEIVALLDAKPALLTPVRP